jgi:hypothetical protein
MLDGMRPGAVVVDLAVAQGGNCFGTIPGATVERRGVLLIGADALPSTVPNHASALYARNIATLVEHVLGEDGRYMEAVPSKNRVAWYDDAAVADAIAEGKSYARSVEGQLARTHADTIRTEHARVTGNKGRLQLVALADTGDGTATATSAM